MMTIAKVGIYPTVHAENAITDLDYQLVVRLRNGELAAFEQIVEKYRQRIVNFSARMLRDPNEAEDVAQSVFVQAFRALAGFQFEAKVSTWLYLIARNLSFNELRRRGRHPLISLDHQNEQRSDQQIEDTCIRPAWELLSYTELAEQIERALATLPEPQRKAILLSVERQVSYREIAGILGLSVPATKSLIHRGRRKLKRKLMRYLRTGTETFATPLK
jgi:RNA polymerase sigma-70 factor (ECF subfamily)